MNSAYYLTKIKELQESKSKVNGLFSYITECETDLDKSQKYMDNLTICGEPLDKGKVKEIVTSLENITSDFNAIIKECDTKIAEYQEKYEAALKAEAEAEAAKKAAQQSKTETTIN